PLPRGGRGCPSRSDGRVRVFPFATHRRRTAFADAQPTAGQLRQVSTDAERRIWPALRDGRLKGYRIPLIALATLGGAAVQVWKTIVPGQDLPSREDAGLMARPRWSAAATGECVRSLLAQHQRRLQELARNTKQAGSGRRPSDRRSPAFSSCSR